MMDCTELSAIIAAWSSRYLNLRTIFCKRSSTWYDPSVTSSSSKSIFNRRGWNKKLALFIAQQFLPKSSSRNYNLNKTNHGRGLTKHPDCILLTRSAPQREHSTWQVSIAQHDLVKAWARQLQIKRGFTHEKARSALISCRLRNFRPILTRENYYHYGESIILNNSFAISNFRATITEGDPRAHSNLQESFTDNYYYLGARSSDSSL